ncbi:hypothetical protein NDU88_004172 [Pleurodeles waltl]|uniref:Uncharacterized protein n=1 Tax=Pleurodeles waltl TaxID=8319 RepID=A0AAV7SI30_PLEWA|nr:hypothetical protein NDU88_004172 [Pleurodeles waltl]
MGFWRKVERTLSQLLGLLGVLENLGGQRCEQIMVGVATVVANLWNYSRNPTLTEWWPVMDTCAKMEQRVTKHEAACRNTPRSEAGDGHTVDLKELGEGAVVKNVVY